MRCNSVFLQSPEFSTQSLFLFDIITVIVSQMPNWKRDGRGNDAGSREKHLPEHPWNEPLKIRCSTNARTCGCYRRSRVSAFSCDLAVLKKNEWIKQSKDEKQNFTVWDIRCLHAGHLRFVERNGNLYRQALLFSGMALTSALKNVGAETWLKAASESKPSGRPLLRCCSCFTLLPHLLPPQNINLSALLHESQAQIKRDSFKWIAESSYGLQLTQESMCHF